MFEIEISEFIDDHYFIAIFKGELTRRPLLDLIDRMNLYEAKYPGYNLLFDLTEVTMVSVGFEDLRTIAKYLNDNDKTTGKMALLIDDNIGRFILAKLFTELTGIFRPNREKAFRKKEDAIAWLGVDFSRPEPPGSP